MRIRAAYRVGPDLKFLGNFDMMHLVERALRRASINYSLTEGFNPHIRLSMGTILPVGVWGTSEYFDLELSDNCADFMERMNQVLPEGMYIYECREIPQEAPSLMNTINAAAYTFPIDLPYEEVQKAAEEILMKTEIPIQSRGKKKDKIKDLRSGIYSAKAMAVDEQHSILTLVVSVNEPINIRYDELMDMLQLFGLSNDVIADCYRQGNYIKAADHFYTPFEKVS